MVVVIRLPTSTVFPFKPNNMKRNKVENMAFVGMPSKLNNHATFA